MDPKQKLIADIRSRALTLREPSRLTSPPPIRQIAPVVRVIEIDIPRMCAVHNKPYISRYLREPNGRARYGRPINFRERSAEQYSDDQRQVIALERGDLADEECYWCGAWGHAAVFCTKCRRFMCYGRVDSRNYFLCSSTCPGAGKLFDCDIEHKGVRPWLGNGNRTQG